VTDEKQRRLDETLDKLRLGELIDLIGSIQLADAGSRSKDLLGCVFEYLLTQFASAEGKNGGQFYTPSCIVRLLVEMLAPYKGRIYDPACGSGGMFVQSEKFVESHGGKLGDILICGQESNPTTRRLIMNLALRGVEADFGPEQEDTFRRDLHPDLRADYILANGSMSSNQSGEGDIRKAIIDADLVDCMVALSGQLFYSTSICPEGDNWKDVRRFLYLFDFYGISCPFVKGFSDGRYVRNLPLGRVAVRMISVFVECHNSVGRLLCE
jgi:type I restriction enzyme M protein